MCAIAPTHAFAEDEVIHYMDKDGNTCEIAKSEVLEPRAKDMTATLENGKTYFLSESADLFYKMQVKGNVTLILGRGARIRTYHFINCSKGNSITITSQLDHPELAPGRFESVHQTEGNQAFIGGREDEDGGDIAICGCYVYAYGGSNAAGIGGGKCGSGGKVTIRNAEVEAIGGCVAAGIGGGGCGFFTDAGDGGEVLIVDSKVTARVICSDGTGAGIGGGGDTWANAGDQGNGGKVTILGNSIVDAEGGEGSAIGRGDDEGEVGTVILDDHLKVTDLSLNKGAVATAAEREGYCYYRNHVRIEPCEHEGKTYDISPTAHKYMCPHCYAVSEVVDFHEFGEDGSCATCGYHTNAPFFTAPELGEGDKEYVVFWLDVNGMDEPTFKASYIDIEVEEPGKEPQTRRDALSQWGELRGDQRSYATWELDDCSDDTMVTATVHYGQGLEASQTTTLGELRAADKQGLPEPSLSLESGE